MVTVYSKPSCVQCKATYRELDKHGIEYEVKDLTQEPEKLAQFQELKMLQAPVVEANGERWFGFRPDLIKAHASTAV